MKKFLIDMLSARNGRISSKRVIGSITYIAVTIASIILAFRQCDKCIEPLELIILSSGSLIGVTALEAIFKDKYKKE